MLAAVDRIAPFAVSWIQGRGAHYLCHPCADIAFGVFSQDLGADVIEVRLSSRFQVLEFRVKGLRSRV
jgi:hypothetical protein